MDPENLSKESFSSMLFLSFFSQNYTISWCLRVYIYIVVCDIHASRYELVVEDLQRNLLVI